MAPRRAIGLEQEPRIRRLGPRFLEQAAQGGHVSRPERDLGTLQHVARIASGERQAAIQDADRLTRLVPLREAACRRIALGGALVLQRPEHVQPERQIDGRPQDARALLGPELARVRREQPLAAGFVMSPGTRLRLDAVNSQFTDTSHDTSVFWSLPQLGALKVTARGYLTTEE